MVDKLTPREPWTSDIKSTRYQSVAKDPLQCWRVTRREGLQEHAPICAHVRNSSHRAPEHYPNHILSMLMLSPNLPA